MMMVMVATMMLTIMMTDDDDGDREDNGDRHSTAISIQNNNFLDAMLVFTRCQERIQR